jgi:ElaB/YqjD/DUF883 family membrane-anchored ribosome-binding protein
MDHEADLIRQQMMETRTSLTEKLETLECQVLGTVHETTDAARSTVTTVKDAVAETMDNFKESVQDAVESVKDSLNVERQTRRHPWVMVGGSLAFGFIGGRILHRAMHGSNGAGRTERMLDTHRFAPAARTAEERRPDGRAATQQYAAATTSQEPGWLARLSAQFAPEIAKLKGTAIGAAAAALRDAVEPSVPESLHGRFREILDGVVTKLGGQPVHEPILNSHPEESYRAQYTG